MEEEKTNLRLDIDIQKLETEKLRKEKNKAKEKLGSLKTDYKKLRLQMRTARLEAKRGFRKELVRKPKGKGRVKG
ncbi:hypothetical protein Gotur_031893 [Gossypium turneri]